ncbi:MAG: cytidylate kinase, partial [Candidatus Nitrosothermus koennekii]
MRTIIISGMPAVGKTTVAEAIAKHLSLKHYSGGDILKDMAKDYGYNVSGNDWWDKDNGMMFLKERMKNYELDKRLDAYLLDIAKKGDAVITSYTLPWLAEDCIKFWFKGSVESRAKRMSIRDNIPYEEALKIVKKRDEENKRLYLDIYNIR